MNRLTSFLTQIVSAQLQELERAKEIAEATVSAKTKALAGLAHEVKTQLTTISAYTQRLQSNPEIPSQPKQQIQIIARCTQYILTLIDDILDFSKTERQKLKLHPIETNLTSVLTEIVEGCQINVRSKFLTFTYSIPQLTEPILIDRKRLRQVLFNLLSNAIKFTSTGGVTFTVMVEKVERIEAQTTSLTISFEVTDTGSGIPPEQLEKIFRPFEQGEVLGTNNNGIGLGLSISQKLVELMGGKLEVQSVLNEGSTFSFMLTVPTTASELLEIQQSEAVSEPVPIKNTLTPAQMDRVRETIMIGDFEEIEAMLQALKKSSPQSESFIERLLILLKNCKFTEIDQLIEAQLKSRRTP